MDTDKRHAVEFRRLTRQISEVAGDALNYDEEQKSIDEFEDQSERTVVLITRLKEWQWAHANVLDFQREVEFLEQLTTDQPEKDLSVFVTGVLHKAQSLRITMQWCSKRGGGGGGAWGARAPPFSKKKKRRLLGIFKKIKIIGNTLHKNRYLHLNVCLGFLTNC